MIKPNRKRPSDPNHVVVTTEVEAGGMQVKIPNACNFMQIKHMNPFEMLTAEKVKFHFNT